MGDLERLLQRSRASRSSPLQKNGDKNQPQSSVGLENIPSHVRVPSPCDSQEHRQRILPPLSFSPVTFSSARPTGFFKQKRGEKGKCL